MRVRTLRIEVVSLDEQMAGMEDQIQKWKRGETRAPRERVAFESTEDLRRFMSSARYRLLGVIRREKPQSIYELARIVGRDRKSVIMDLKVLLALGLVTTTRSRSGGRRRTVPVVPYDRIEISMEI